jgi:hypothetical protein
MANANVAHDPNSHKFSLEGLKRTSSSLGNRTMKVAKFVAHMQGKKVDSSTSSGSLNGRSAVPASPQGTIASAPAQDADADPEATALGKELQILADAIETSGNQISIGAKFITRIKSWFGGDSYDIAIAKQAE